MMRIFPFIFAFFAVLATGAENLNTWQKQMPITFSGYTLPGNETLTNFPALVILSNTTAGVGFAYSNFLSPSYADLRFAADDKTTLLNFEVEKWDTNGNSYVWVQVPALVDTNTQIWAFWGKSGVSATPCTTNGAVWDSTFKAVWHLASNTNISTKDSTSSAFNGTNNGVISVTGIIDGAGSFNGALTNCITVGAGPTNARTILFWMNPSIAQNYPMSLGALAFNVLGKWGYFSGAPYTRYVNGVMASETLGSEIISNPSFSINTTSWLAANGASLSRDTSTYNSAPACVKFQFAATPGKGTCYQASRSFTANRLYKISAWIKGQYNGEVFSAGCSEWGTWVNAGGAHNLNVTTNWALYSWYFYAVKTTSAGYLRFEAPGGNNQYYYVDDVSIKEVTGDSSGVQNGEWSHVALVSDIPFSADNIIFGQSLDGSFTGALDEVRISTGALSSNWIWACYMNAASNNVFNTYGAPALVGVSGTIIYAW